MDLSELYYYDATSPTFLRWNKDIFSGRYHNQKNVSKGNVAGGMGNSGYYQVRVNGRLTLVHRVIWELLNGEIPDGMFIDHIDQDKTNNDISNLRVVTRAGNNQNHPLRQDSSSGVVGVNRLVNTLRSGNLAIYWKALWCEDGERKYKLFPVKKYGEDEAFRMACEYRKLMIEKMNQEGAGYTENHGK